MSHPHLDDHPRTAADSVRQLKALRLMIVILIPIAIWTVVGLVVYWPGQISEHVRSDLSQYSVTGLQIPTGEITKVTPVSCSGQPGSTPGQSGDQGTCASLDVRVLEGPEKGQQVQVTITDAIYSSGADVGDKVKLFRVPTDTAPAYQFADFDRSTPLIIILVVFALVVIAVARWRGFASLIGLGFAGFILVKFLFPALVSGSNPIAVGLIASSAIMFVVLYAAHGFSARTTTALLGTLFGVLLSAGLGWGATVWTHLTGVSSDDDYLLAATAPDLKLTSVVMTAVIIAGLGVLNDVTITQASAVWELADADRDHSKLFSRAMRIGRDHIASTVYTIAFATAGASLGALLLIAIYDRPLFEVLQTEAFAGEIVRTLVGSIGLVLAVPLTTAIGVAVVRVGDRGAAKQLGAATAVTGRKTWKVSAAVPASRTGSTEPSITDDELEPTEARPEAERAADAVDATDATDEAPQTEAKSAAPTPEADAPSSTPPPDPSAEAAKSRRTRRRRTRGDDDFGDFSDLRDPDQPDRPRRGRD